MMDKPTPEDRRDGLKAKLGQEMEDNVNEVRMEAGMRQGVHLMDGQANVYPIGVNEVMQTAFVCCDCGLVHLAEIEHDGESVSIRWTRADAATQEFRDEASKARAKAFSTRRVQDEFARARCSPNAEAKASAERR